MSNRSRLAILVGGGPAPGINSVIGAATIRAALDGSAIVGVRDGFKWLVRGDITHVDALTIETVSRIHFQGGSVLGTSRTNPTRDPADLRATADALQRLGVDRLITIGGDDTAFSALRLQEEATGRLRVAHVPKTIDNDLDLPLGVPTFGFQTARHVGVDIVKNLMMDAKTTGRWYLILTMGRQAGHLALGIGKAAGTTLTVIPEEFPAGPIRLNRLVDTLAGAVLKRLSHGRVDGTAVLAEGLSERLAREDLAAIGEVERDAHGHPRLAELGLGPLVKARLQQRLAGFGVHPTLVVKDIGYELRCADPIPFDMEYTRDLGFLAADYLHEGGSAAMVTLQAGHFHPIPLLSMLDPETGRTRVRLVDTATAHYQIARSYMVRLGSEDLDDPTRLANLARQAHLTPDQFREQLGYVVLDEPARRDPVVAG